MATQKKTSTAGMAARFPKADLGNPEQFRFAVQNIQNVYHATPDQVRQSARHWYDDVHEAVTKGVRRTGLSHWQGSGLVAAVSPNMDWEGRNIQAFKELTKLKQTHWDAIERSAAAPGGRSGEAASVLQGMSISHAADPALVKAHRIMRGEDPDVVLPRRTAPKTHSFATNIEDPGVPGHVTVDYRAHDIATNQMLRVDYSGRGISSAALPSGQKTRYEHFEDAYRSAAGSISARTGEDYLPHQIQAITWEGAKRLEKGVPSKSGAPRKVGVRRVGQGYPL